MKKKIDKRNYQPDNVLTLISNIPFYFLPLFKYFYHRLRRDIEENHRTVADTTQREYESIRSEQERRHTSETHELKEKLTLEKQNWEENYMKQQETILASKERELREQMKRERDKEIEQIIAKFESDTTTTKEEVERNAENRVK
jgi:5-azacytidine-induced protein 1